MKNVCIKIASFCCQQPQRNFAYVSQESLSRAMRAAEQDIKLKKDAAENHSADIPKYHTSHRTNIMNSREYVKRLKRRRQRDSRVGCIMYLLSVMRGTTSARLIFTPPECWSDVALSYLDPVHFCLGDWEICL